MSIEPQLVFYGGGKFGAEEFLSHKPKGSMIINPETPNKAYYAPTVVANAIESYGESKLSQAIVRTQMDACESQDSSGVRMAQQFEGVVRPWLYKDILQDMKQRDRKDAVADRLRAKLAARKAGK